MMCSICKGWVHVKCACVSRTHAANVDRNEWKCEACLDELHDNRVRMPDGVNDCLNDGNGDGAICVVQWNADGLRTKVRELEDWLIRMNADVVLIQESKLRSEDSVKVRGFNVVRRDRSRALLGQSRGGGLVCLVRNDWQYLVRDCDVARDDALEVMWIDVIDASKNVWHCVNVYVPPASGVNVDLSVLERLPRMDAGCWIVGGDWNGHHTCWDAVAEQDDRGEWLLEWYDDRGLVVMNDGSMTRKERGTARQSSPDVTLVSRNMATDCHWSVCEKFMSDHLPLVLKYGVELVEKRCVQRCVWDWKGANWGAFREELRRLAVNVDWGSMNVTEFEKCLREGILSAGKEWVGRKVLGRNLEPTLSRETLDAIRHREELRSGGTRHGRR